MNANAVDYWTESQQDEQTECVWKIVLKDNLSGQGTSFDPTNLTCGAYRCLTCDGFAGDCGAYAA